MREPDTLGRSGQTRDGIVIAGVSVLGSWVSDVVMDLCARATPAVEFRLVERVDLRDDLGQAEGPPRIFLSQHPGRAVIAAIEGRTIPVAAVLDDPVDSVRHIKAQFNCDVTIALRLQTSMAAANHLLVQYPALTLVYRGHKSQARDVIRLLAESFALPIEPDALATTLEQFGGSPDEALSLEAALARRVPGYVRLDALGAQVPGDEATLTRQVLSPMVLGAIRSDITPITWPRHVFLHGDNPNNPAPEEVELAGSARIIYYGPYFHLPFGSWTVRFVIGFSIEARDTPFLLVVNSQSGVLAKAFLRPTTGGDFEGTFTIQHRFPYDWLEIQLASHEGSIDGRLSLREISFQRFAMPGRALSEP